MIRVVAVLILAVLGMADQARACTTRASSTFCADGWVARPMDRPDGQDQAGEQPGAWAEEGGADPSFGGDGIYVEGAVGLDGPIPGDDGQL